MMISSNLNDSYNYLVTNGNLNDGIIYESYRTSVQDDDPNTADVDETKLTGEAAQIENKRQFREKLNQILGPENYRQFKSIDYNASSSGFIYKVIETNIDYTIDKVVMYGGNFVPNLEYDFAKIIQDATWNENNITPESTTARMELLSIICRASFSGGESSNYLNNFKKYYNECLSRNLDPITVYNSTKNKTNSMKIFKRFLTPDASDYVELRDKGYRLSCSIPDGTSPESFNFDNFSSYSLILPEYVINNHNKKTLSDQYYNEYVNNFANSNSNATQTEFETWLKSVPNEYKITIDNSELLIVGNGISPDFMYPVYDFSRITPNTNTEIISYGNIGAYSLLQDANRTSPVDDYIVFKFSDYSSATINTLNELTKQYMAWPENIRAVYAVDDTSNILSPTGVRVNFLPQLVDMQIVLSNVLSLFISVLTCIIFIFAVRKFIHDNNSSLAILRANGFKKRWLVWIMPLFAIIPSLAGWAIGYSIAQFTQRALLSLYSSYWIVPTSISAISPLLFVFGLLVPLAIMGVLAIIFTYLTLRKNTRQLMSESSRFSISPLAKIVTRLLPKSSVMAKFKVSIALSSMPKLIATTGLFTVFSLFTSFSFSLVGKFDYIKDVTFNTKKYTYALDFITPTVQGGGYVSQSFKDAGKIVVNDNNEPVSFNGAAVDSYYNKIRGQTNSSNLTLYTVNEQDGTYNINPNIISNLLANDTNSTVTNVGSFSLSHIPSFNDSDWQASQFTYLKYRMETPLIVDTQIGLGTNPWNIARALMPSNSIAQSNKMTNAVWTTMIEDEEVYFNDENLAQYKTLSTNDFRTLKNNLNNKPLYQILIDLKYMISEESNPSGFESSAEFDRVYNTNNSNIPQGWYYVDRSKFKAGLGFSLKNEFLVIMNQIFNTPKYQDNIYKVLYNIAILEKDDETYTKSLVNYANSDGIEQISLMGIKPDSKYIELLNENGDDVKSKLWLPNNIEQKYQDHIHDIYDENSFFNENTTFSLIINKSAAHQYNLDVGSIISLDPQEEATRFNPKNYSNSSSVVDYSSLNSKNYKFKVVEIIESYQNPEFYINQRVANYINNMHLQPILEQSFYTTYNYDDALGRDVGYVTKQIDPWNGIFSNQEVNKNISVNQILYSPSGLSPAGDTIGYNDANYKLVKSALESTVSDLANPGKQENYISKISLAKALGYVDPTTFEVTNESMKNFESDYPNYSIDVAKQIIEMVISNYSSSPFLSSVNSAESVSMYVQIFDNVSQFVNNMLILILIIVLIISMLSIMILSMDFISSSIALCSMLKVLGFYDHTNAFTFLSMFIPSAILGVIISIPLTIVFNQFVTNFIYNFSTILIPLSYQWWIVFVSGALITVIVLFTVLFAIYVLKRQNLPKIISGF